MSTEPHTTTRRDDQSPIAFAIDFAHQRGWGPFLRAAVLGLFGFLLLPLVVVAGYSYRLARAAATDADQPALADFRGLFVDGLRFLVAVLPAALVVGAGTAAVAQVSSLLATLVYVTGMIALPAVVLSFVAGGSVRGTYDVERLRRIVTAGAYLRALVVYVVLSLVASVLVVVSVVTVVGPLLVATFAVLVFAAYWGRVYLDGVRDGEWPAPTVRDRDERSESTGA